MTRFGTPIPARWTVGAAVAALSLSAVGPQQASLAPPAPAAAESPFVLSSTCAQCHARSSRARAMRDAKGRSVAPFDLWRSSMMANSARDPFWRAMVSAEVAATPSQKRAIEAKCMRCHTPMADDRSGEALLSIAILTDPDHPSHDLARDGVSCTVCHLMTPDGLGSEASFSGHFQIDKAGRAFGPHADPFAMPMRRHSGLTPTQGGHILQSNLCGSCHTLETTALDSAGKAVGAVLPEQTPYLEWRNSSYSTEVEKPGALAASCQDCHVPTADADGVPIRTAIAHNPGGRDWPFLPRRSPFGRHVFVGGNALLPEIFRDNRAALGVTAPKAAFDATIALVKDQIRRRTATLSIEGLRRVAGGLAFEVRVQNRTGHKFPSAYPSRRAWVQVRVRDAAGGLVFESGGFDAAGRILGADGAPLPEEGVGGPAFPHRAKVARPEEVPVFEALMGDGTGGVTYRLMRGARFLKDNRLLPTGWRDDGPGADRIGPVGTAGDPGFRGGETTVAYAVAVTDPAGPFTVEARLHYQTLGARFAAELFTVATPEVRAFEGYWKKATRTPLLVDESVGRLPGRDRR